MDIIIKKNEVRKMGDKIIDYSNDFMNDIKKFNSIIDSINIAWDGADSLRYINTMREKHVAGLEELKSAIQEYGEYLKNIPEAYSIVDEVFSSKYIDV